MLPSGSVHQNAVAASPVVQSPADVVESAFRPGGMYPDDEKIINSAFLRGLRESSYTHGLPSDTFFAIGRQAWTGIQADFETTIACPPHDGTEVQGFITYGKDETGVACVAWLYVAKAWRRQGIGTKLLTDAGVQKHVRFPVIFANPQKLAVFRSKGYQPAFVPFLSWKWLVDGVTTKGSLP